MHVDDPAAADITVPVGDEEYRADATADHDSDGVDDTALVVHADGSAQAFTDVDGDGQADLRTELDAHGVRTGEASYDAATGEWVDSSGSSEPRMVGGGGPLSVETPLGAKDLGPPSHDTDGDGVPDTVVVTDSAGSSVLYTDVDGDGCADVATEITSEGRVTVSEHVGDGQWTVVERGRLIPDGSYERADGRADDTSAGFDSPGVDAPSSASSGSASAGAGVGGSDSARQTPDVTSAPPATQGGGGIR
ncbi:MAG: DUF6802 family protein [Pseudonocardiaceae bacterium]